MTFGTLCIYESTNDIKISRLLTCSYIGTEINAVNAIAKVKLNMQQHSDYQCAQNARVNCVHSGKVFTFRILLH
jgi:hypothetical protein